MASLAQQIFSPLSSTKLINSSNIKTPYNGCCCFNLTKRRQLPLTRRKLVIVAAAVAVSNAETRERMELKQMFQEAYEKCRTAPMEGVSFTLDDFHSALDKYDFNSEIGTRVMGSSSSLPFSVFSYASMGCLHILLVSYWFCWINLMVEKYVLILR